MTCASLALPSPKSNPSDPLERLLADPVKRLAVEERFWPKIMRPVDWDACWPWTGSRKRTGDKDGYGNFKLSSYRTVRSHRLAFALYTGRSPGELCVCHRCDNPICCNPTHLFLGTHKDNSDDKIAKGRNRTGNQKGESNPRARLTLDQVATIKTLIGNGLTNVAIGRQFGVSHYLVSKIRRGRAWGTEPMQPKYESLRV